MRRLMRVGALAALIACVAGTTAALAANPRSLPTVAGARALVTQYVNGLISGNTQATCALFTAKGKREIERQTSTKSCALAIAFAHVLLAHDAKQQAKVRRYAKTVAITIHGHTASVPNESGSGITQLLYTAGLWYLN